MKKKLTALLLALMMLAQVLVPETVWALKESQNYPVEDSKLVEVAKIDAENYPKLTNKVILDIQKEATLNSRKNIQNKSGVLPFNTPYLPGQDIPDEDKPRIVGKVFADFKTIGLDGGTFDWEGVFGKDSNGNPGKAKLVFQQWLNNKETDVSYELEVNKDGTYSWKDWQGEPARIPLYSKSLEPYTYSVYLDQDVSEKVKLLTYRIVGTPSEGGFEKDPETGLNIANIVIDLSIQQVASTKFVSEWNTGLAEDARPPVEGEFDNKIDEYPGYFPFSLENNGQIIIRNDFVNNSDYEDPGYTEFGSSSLVKKPEVKVIEGLEFADENDEEGSPTYNLDEANKTITTLDKQHKFKYDFTYDVINGGTLTMTEIIPVIFDANGGKFASITDESAEQKIVKEVDYNGTLTEAVEEPKKELETFKGWSLTKGGAIATDADFANITEAKTFYAIWDNNDITAKEIVVGESFKINPNGTGYTNDLGPSYDDLRKQVQVKDDKGNLVPLPKDAEFHILDGNGYYNSNSDEFKQYMYGKVQEKDDGKTSRTETVTAEVIYTNGTKQKVEIPIKVIKNIYEGTSTGGKPDYVPDNYVKVTVDPTDKATNPQKTYYYVNPNNNPKVQVLIPVSDPIGKDDNVFTKWTKKADSASGDGSYYDINTRDHFSGATTITAQYESDVIPQEGDTKPEGVPGNFVKVTFVPTDNGTMEGAKIFWVNPTKEVTIPVNNPVGKTYYTFKEWKIGDVTTGETYTVGMPKQFTDKNGTIITATYTESKNIIPYNPKEPITRPEGYVRITFATEKGLELTEQKAYYVKKNAKDAAGNPITLGNAELVKPAYKEETGYKFDKWDKKDDLVIEAADIVVTAKATTLDDVVPKDKPQGGENDKPAGYISVTFKTTDKAGSIEKVVYINPNKAVALEGQAPEVNPITGYEFADWDRPIKEKIQYKDNDEITAQFNKIGDVVPGDKAQPAGYVKVIFDKGEHGELSGTTSYWVKPEVEVTVEAPSVKANTGYKFTKWDKETTLTAKTTDTEIKITAEYEKLDDIIPSTNDEGKPNAKPEGYVTVTFDKGEHGTLSGQTVYYVNPEADPVKTLAEITKPTVEAETGYKFTSWNFADTEEITSDITVIAQYDPIDDVIPKDNPQGGENEKPEGYITVTFDKGEHGELEGNTTFYINPNKAVVLEGKAPTVKPNTGYDFADWDTQIVKRIQYSDGDTIKALYNEKEDVIPQENPDGSDKPAGYVTVTFDKGDHGELSGKTVYYVNPNKQVTVPAPTVTANTGFEFDKWDKELTQKFTDNTTIKAEYKELGDIIPQEKKDGSDKPKGYVTVKFEAVNGTLSGTTVYYVNPNKEVDLTNTANAITKRPNVGYKAEGGTWDKELKATFKEGDVLKFTFNKVDDVVEIIGGNPRPEGYVRVDVIPTYFAKDPTIKSYWVNPTKEVTIPPMDIQPLNDSVKFLGWDQPFTQQFKYHTNIVAKFERVSKPTPPTPGGPGGYYPGGYGFIVGKTTEKIVKVPDNSYLKEVWYMQGFNGDFRPKDGLTRAEAAQILANALVEDGYRYNPNFKLPYRDIGEEWYTKAIKIVTEARVFEGYDDGNFNPQWKITRNEWIATLKRFQELGDATGNHMNLNKGHWATAEIEAAYNAGWLKIYTDGVATYEGDKFIPRQEVAAVSNKAFNRVLDKTYIRKNDRNLVTYRDVSKDMWAYDDILCASNTFLTKRDMYYAQWVDRDNNMFNIYTKGFDIVQAKFQRIPR